MGMGMGMGMGMVTSERQGLRVQQRGLDGVGLGHSRNYTLLNSEST